MISRSIYICSKNELLEDILMDFGITSDNISSYGKEAPFLENKKNGALVEQVQGDFTHAVDFDLFDRDLPEVIQLFEKISESGVDVAMPDDDDDDPEVFHLWREGKRLLVRIFEDEDEKIRLLDPLSNAELQ